MALAGMQNGQASSPTGNNFEDMLSAIAAQTSEQPGGPHFPTEWTSANLFELENLGVVGPLPQQQTQHQQQQHSESSSSTRTPVDRRSPNKTARAGGRAPVNGGAMLENIGRVPLEKRKSNTRTRLIERSVEPEWVHRATPESEKLRKQVANQFVSSLPLTAKQNPFFFFPFLLTVVIDFQ
jgi:hypothetical protein